MKKQIVYIWFYGSLGVASWMLGTTGLYLLGKGHNTTWGSVMLFGVFILWGLATILKVKTIDQISFEQVKGGILWSLALFLFTSLFLVLIVVSTPNDPIARGDLFYWEKLISYGSLALSLLISFIIFFRWNQLK